jgi:pyruvate dehydrogenase E2 component (dihydrolipoamide acetyltransferase)
MASDVNLPELGENIEGGTVVDVLVTVGDQVEAGQALFEVEAGKGTVEVPSPFGGTVAQILVNKGDEIKTGQLLIKIETGDGRAPAAGKPGASKSEERSVAKLPPKNEQVQRPPEKQTTRGAPAVGATEVTAEKSNQPTAPRAEPEFLDADHSPANLVLASPATRQLARELGVNIAQVKGSAKNGRVTADDVKAFVRQLAATPVATGPLAMQQPRLPDFGKWGPVETQPLSSIRQETARQMALSWEQIPHVTQHDLADITDLDAFRRAQAEAGLKITVTAFALKAAAIALQESAQFNATLDLANNRLILKRYYHIGVAVDTERGLLVPVIPNVDKKSVYQLAGELTEVADRARQRKITSENLSGGTFTITNLGGIGGTGFTPIIRFPEVAILGLSRARLQPALYKGNVTPRLLLPVSLSYDHRVIDGADAARFTRRIAELLENPLVMLLYA